MTPDLYVETSNNKTSLLAAIESHQRWLRGGLPEGDQFNAGKHMDALQGAVICGADFEGAIFNDANLSGISFQHCDLSYVSFEGARLTKCSFEVCDLTSADFHRAELSGCQLANSRFAFANLRTTRISEARISRGDFYDARTGYRTVFEDCEADYLTRGYHLACPTEGQFVAWKKAGRTALIKLLIPACAARSSATTHKCRASRVHPIAIYRLPDEGTRTFDPSWPQQDSTHSLCGRTYRVGHDAVCADWEPNRWVEFGGGIHFFLTPTQALAG